MSVQVIQGIECVKMVDVLFNRPVLMQVDRTTHIHKVVDTEHVKDVELDFYQCIVNDEIMTMLVSHRFKRVIDSTDDDIIYLHLYQKDHEYNPGVSKLDYFRSLVYDVLEEGTYNTLSKNASRFGVALSKEATCEVKGFASERDAMIRMAEADNERLGYQCWTVDTNAEVWDYDLNQMVIGTEIYREIDYDTISFSFNAVGKFLGCKSK